MIRPIRHVDLNADLGEGFPWDEAMLDRVTSASICCGAHAGDESTSRRAIDAALARGVAIGAHPGYPDREHFGRQPMTLPPDGIREIVTAQVEALMAWAREAGAVVRYLKPHGALYNQARDDPRVAAEVMNAARELDLPVFGLPFGLMSLYPRFFVEGFADRRYEGRGRLVPRSDPRAMLTDPDEMVAQVRLLVEVDVRTICLHGDEPGCVERADRVREALTRAGIGVRGLFAEDQDDTP